VDHNSCLVDIKTIAPPKVVFEGTGENILTPSAKARFLWQVHELAIDPLKKPSRTHIEVLSRLI
jgi:hypothetical protein